MTASTLALSCFSAPPGLHPRGNQSIDASQCASEGSLCFKIQDCPALTHGTISRTEDSTELCPGSLFSQHLGHPGGLSGPTAVLTTLPLQSSSLGLPAGGSHSAVLPCLWLEAREWGDPPQLWSWASCLPSHVQEPKS